MSELSKDPLCPHCQRTRDICKSTVVRVLTLLKQRQEQTSEILSSLKRLTAEMKYTEKRVAAIEVATEEEINGKDNG